MTLIWSCYYLICVILQMTIYIRKKQPWAELRAQILWCKALKDYCSIEVSLGLHHSEVGTTGTPLIAVCMDKSNVVKMVLLETGPKNHVSLSSRVSVCRYEKFSEGPTALKQSRALLSDSNLSSINENGSWYTICSKFTKRTLKQDCGWMKARLNFGGGGSVMVCF